MSNNNNISSIILTEHRCRCGKLLFKGLLFSSALEIKCKRCDALCVIGDNDNHDNNGHYSILFDMNTRIVDVSPSATEILGYSKEELIATRIQQIDPFFPVSLNLGNGNPFAWETTHQNKYGVFFPVKSRVSLIKNHVATNILATFECMPLPTEKRTRNHCALVAKIDPSGMYTHVSTTLATLLGYSSIEMLGNYIFTFHPAKEQVILKKMLLQNLQTQESFKLLPYTMLGKNKTVINLESYFASDFNDRGQFTGFKIMNWQI